MSISNNPRRFNWRKNPRPSAPQAEQSSADAGEEIGEGQLFQGMRFDPEQIGMHHFPHRAYSPTLADWANYEPLAYVDGLNVYPTMRDDPINALNPLGE